MPLPKSLDGFYKKIDLWLNEILPLKKKVNFAQFFRFCTVGAIGTLINLFVFVLSIEILNIHYIAAAIIAFAFAVTNNFILNQRWTFSDKGGGQIKKYVYFVSVSIVGLFINLVVLYIMVEFIGLHYIPSQIIAVLAGLISNFMFSKYLVFKS